MNFFISVYGSPSSILKLLTYLNHIILLRLKEAFLRQFLIKLFYFHKSVHDVETAIAPAAKASSTSDCFLINPPAIIGMFVC